MNAPAPAPTVKIDGREIQVPKGTTVLQAAEQLGFEVPQMCYHPGLKIVGVCRVCLCQVKGWPKMTPACATEVADGMEVGLYTPEAEKARRAVIEFWLLNHPLDCPVCDQGGECPLQDIAFDHGPGTSRLTIPKVRKEKRMSLGPHVVLDEERCILCWRCTRFTQEVSGTHQIMLKERGVYTVVGTPPGVVLDDPYSGNVVDLCPVGALTSHDFRFRSRIWEMASSEGVCTACAVGCNTYVWSKKGRVERLTSRPNLRVNDYWLCDRGRFDIAFVNDPKRLAFPRLRVDGKLVEVEWDEAVRALADGLRPALQGKANQAAALFTRHLANEEYWVFQKFLRSQLGSNHLAAGRTELLTPARVDLARRGRLLGTVTDLERVEAILVLGGDLEKTHPVAALRVRKAVRDRGVKLFLATPDPERLDGLATTVERVGRGMAASWLMKLTGALRADGKQGVAAGLAGVRSLALVVNAGDENAEIAEAVEAFLGAGPRDASWKALFYDDGANAAGAAALGVSGHWFPGSKAIAGDEAQVWKTRWGGRVSPEPGKGWADILEGAARGDIRALLLVNSGRPAGWGWTERERALLAKAPFVAAFDLFAEDVERFAHVVLPAPSFAEFDATYTTGDGVVQLARRNIVPRAPVTTQTLQRVAAQLGVKLKATLPIDAFRELSRDVPQFGGLDYGIVSRGGARGERAAESAGVR
jgi:NADH-quinone oxidoreductase subunit G